MAELIKEEKKFIPKEKRWAAELSQVEFEQEWVRKYPRADAIPLAALWIYEVPAKSRGIDGIPSNYEFEPDPVEVKKDVKVPPSNEELDKKKEIKSGKDRVFRLNKPNPKKDK